MVLEACNEAIRLQVRPSHYKYEAYNALQAWQRFEPALDSLNKALEINSLETTDRNSTALAAYNQAIKLSPNDYVIWTNKAFVLYKLERYPEAQTSLEQAIEINATYQPVIDSLSQ